ncbi:LysR family transcriptional regulator [Janthinobacterium agaricidamnosum]|uniref:Bacterial regulatory helix-turn-helix, lysR family protein n=1 Tax=Janthinobacterium agaricidamnosum NBRC 102515 = DSM 9628 TaxID=1349767 RepID=W0V133_9BURK|nr:LysR family transcriptional regulator [Janthinobacterium agaricidamnosum]CDG82529.1 bacterial regulatory helix-turn-helix, lysR family protein [Janthinobacterium agaricidamnosum NBRC 102515 = DSM 9628]
MKFSSNNIELFLAVVDCGSFSAAARKLNRAPSAVSMALANIEAELGIALFDRGQREALPTPAALALIPHARLISGQLRQLHLHAIELSQGLESRVSLAIATEVEKRHFLAAIKALALRYPLLDIEVLSGPQDEVLDLLHRGRVSACLAFGGLQINNEEQFHLVGAESLVATMSPRHPALGGAGQAVYIEDLVQVRQIVVASRDLPLADARTLVGQASWRTDSLGMAIDMVEAGLGWANLPLSVIRPLLEDGRLRRIEFKNTRNGLFCPVHIVWMHNAPLGKAAREFVQLLSQAY